MNEQPVRSVETEALQIAYVEYGPSNGWPVILSHGFPYDVHAFDDVALILARAGARVIVPYTRGLAQHASFLIISCGVGNRPLAAPTSFSLPPPWGWIARYSAASIGAAMHPVWRLRYGLSGLVDSYLTRATT